MGFSWHNATGLGSKSYTCGYCGKALASSAGYYAQTAMGSISRYVYICHFCENATQFNEDDSQSPAPVYGEPITVEDDHVGNLYDEARRCMSVNSYTAAVMCCRKLLMSIAVAQGAKQGLKYIEYVDYFSDNHLVGRAADDCLHEIRDIGNEANHEIAAKSRQDAEALMATVELVLRTLYELPAQARARAAARAKPTS